MAKRSDQAGDQPKAAPLRDIAAPPPLPTVDGGWKTVLADPPWRFTNRTGKVAPEHRRLDRYSTLDLDAICDIPVSTVAARDSHLYLWVPNALLPEGLRVMEAWGYRYVSNVIWAKRRKDGGPDGRGVGFYFRNVTEIILFGVRGSMRTLPHARSQVNMIETRKREHSRKPDEQYGFIEACSPGPYLELFARHPQPRPLFREQLGNGQAVAQGHRAAGELAGDDLDLQLIAEAHRPEEVGLGVGERPGPALGEQGRRQRLAGLGQPADEGVVAVLEDAGEKGDAGGIDVLEAHGLRVAEADRGG